jgi:hypothetical protein
MKLSGGVTHFAEGFGFGLEDVLAGDLQLAADFFEGAAVAVLDFGTIDSVVLGLFGGRCMEPFSRPHNACGCPAKR